MLESPPSGGDTVFVDANEAYERLFPGFKGRLHGLTTHSAHQQAEISVKTDGVLRKPIITAHPVVRQHPITMRKAIFVNSVLLVRLRDIRRRKATTC
ncbi:hypothetical protein BABINDRAFT_162605 [Babjeviella inositovora NRRL Y-12698]|uniref:TauD/TfdA-like domain-containing protein n=1 Tax=Babjeviella inositovora NRRL Y-12698 TaxID=984486 RepID=A0A1E3QMZ7_9ASCO|nr:uncharacterized protein BABINDRAFT_162605 [Babjeviella inositovora NRRL Y-12698]ODQ78367.1 hypothetical protein BABINDRAFT_162605 [Babjeviella inositovora NRRL Y-12698]